MRNAAARSNLLVPEIREVMDIRQASNYLGISPDTLYKYASEGFVPAFKLGNRWRFKRSRLDEWMDRQSDLHARRRSGRGQEEAGAASGDEQPVAGSFQPSACWCGLRGVPGKSDCLFRRILPLAVQAYAQHHSRRTRARMFINQSLPNSRLSRRYA